MHLNSHDSPEYGTQFKISKLGREVGHTGTSKYTKHVNILVAIYSQVFVIFIVGKNEIATYLLHKFSGLIKALHCLDNHIFVQKELENRRYCKVHCFEHRVGSLGQKN